MKWGILATGSIARNFVRTLAGMGNSDEVIVAVGSRDLERAQAFAQGHGIPRAWGSYRELAQDPEVESVYVATPNNLHYENCVMALEAGKHVLCEKPFTTDAAAAERLYALAKEKKLFIMDAFWIRFLPLYGRLRALLRSGELGQVRHIRAEYGFIAKGARRERKFKSELGGGALLDIGIYNLGFLYMITGTAPASFTSEVHLNEFGTDDYSVLQLAYPGGITAHSLQTIGLQFGRKAAVFCERGTIYLEDFQHAESMRVVPVEGEAYTVEAPFGVNGYEYQVLEASRCVREGKSFSEAFAPEDSLCVLRLMDEIRGSWGMRFSFE